MAYAVVKHLLRKYEAKRAKHFRRKLHDAKHRFTCVANFMRRKARFIEKDRLQKQSVFFWWGRTDSLACGRATAGQTVHRTVCLDRPFESTLQIPKRKKVQHQMVLDFLVGEDGFEPSKRYAADLQSVPFGHSGTPPAVQLVVLNEL